MKKSTIVLSLLLLGAASMAYAATGRAWWVNTYVYYDGGRIVGVESRDCNNKVTFWGRRTFWVDIQEHVCYGPEA